MTGPDGGARPAKLPSEAVLATMHGKEVALRPAFHRIGVNLVLPDLIDTDQFGSFSGEIPRHGSVTDAARAKLDAACDRTGHAVGVASEGAYGPHPGVPFLATGHELLLWHDRATNHTVYETLVDYEPVYRQLDVTAETPLEPFLTQIGFPDYAVIVAPRDGDLIHMTKGVQEFAALTAAVRHAVAHSPHGLAIVQTDMRAHMNPRRMRIIGDLGHRLVDRLSVACQSCGAPGFGIIEHVPGLPCEVCGTHTTAVAKQRHGCTLCGASELRSRADGITHADPGQCPRCNP